MVYNFWQDDSELSKALRAVQGLVDNAPSSSQPQQNHHPPSAPVNSYGDPPPTVTQYHSMYGGDSTSNNQVLAPAHLQDAWFSQRNSQFPSDLTPPFRENDHRDIHSAAGQPLPDASFNYFHSPVSNDSFANSLGFSGSVSESYLIEPHPHPVHDNQSESHASCGLCKWNDGHGPCDVTASEEEIVDHLSSSHLPPAGRELMKCKWEGCKLGGFIRRDTILRHIRQIHLRIRPRRQS